MAEKNIFGGGNANSVYRPMSETEQDVIDRLIERDDLRVEVLGWGYVPHPKVKHGDARVQISWNMTFSAPDEPRDVWYFDLELRTQAGVLVFKERQPTIVMGEPLQVQSGLSIDMVWDITVAQMDPNFVKTVLPLVTGLTTRRGNERFTEEQSRVANLLAQNEQALKLVDPAKVRSVMAKVKKRQRR
jgi:hypothetical protein